MWKTLGEVPPGELLDARLEAHHAAQWVARATRAYCQPEPDDSHTTMSWDSHSQALMGRPLSSDLTVGLHLTDLTIIGQSRQGEESFCLIGQTESSVGTWLAELVERHNLDPKKLDKPGPYTLDKHPLDSSMAYGSADKKSREELAKYYNNAAPILEAIRAAYSEASPVRCWPHFFDIATLLTLEQKGTSEKATIGIGLSPGDATFADPYFYVSLWPYPPKESLPPVIEPSFWHLEGFTALIIRASDLVAKKYVELQQGKVKTIMEQGVKASMHLLTH
ncbi:MAG: hypothetical protein MRJ96_06095 [Nitrospirales bacterium]|nr:hypothetical protein [Nitrospira sp.]MDR4501006.1 hypothetical protein [Nitrospirales bacterium]